MTDRVTRIILRADISDLKAKLAAGGQSVKSFADQATGASKESAKWRRGLDEVASSAGKVGLAAGAAFGAMVLKAANFDQAMSNVQAATHESAEAMDTLRQAALDAGAETAFSATEAAGAIENLAKAGVSTNDILAGGLDGALSLAAAGSLEVADAAEIAATALTQFGLSGEDIPHVADLLAAGAGKAQGEVSDLSYALKQSGLVAAQMGVSIEETTGTLSAFASAGLLGSDAGTSFRTMLLRLANPSSTAEKAMRRLGIAAYDAQGNFVGIPSLADQLQKAFEGQTQSTRDAALATIFGSDAIRAANVLYEEGAQGVTDWTNKVNDAGFAAETAAIKQDNLRGDIEKLTGSLETLFITGGEGSQGFLRGATQSLTNFVDLLNKVPGPIKDATSGLLAVTAITGGALWFGSKTIRAVADTRAALKDLNVTMRDTEGNLTRTGRGIKGLGVSAGILVGLAALDGALSKIDKHDPGPTLNELADQLERLNRGDLSDLSKDFGDISEILDIIDSTTGSIASSVESLPVISTLNKAAEGIAGALGLDDKSAATKLDDATSRIETLDSALSNLVTSGTAAQARSAFEALAEAQGLSADEQKELLELLPGYRDALAGSARETDAAASAIERAGKAAGLSADQIEEMGKALEESRDAARDSARGFVGLTDSVADNKVSLKGWIKDMRESAEALKNFRLNAQEAAKKGLDEGLIAALQEAGPEGALRMRQLSNATKQEIAAANDAWRDGQREVEKYVNKVGGVPKDIATELHVHTETSALDSLQYRLNRLSQGYTIPIRTATAVATGGYISGPGTATSDSIPAMLSNGEYVVKAAAVARYGVAMMHAINAQRFAEGGLASRGERAASRTYVTNNNGQPWDSLRNSEDMLRALRTALGEQPVFRASRDTARELADSTTILRSS